MQVLPSELVDAIIDHLDSDTQALAICGLVHSEWLSRSRFHLFSTIQFCPWRVKSFFDITRSNFCTFNGYIKRVEIDDSQCPTHLKSADCQQTFFQMMTSAEFPSDLQVESIQVRNFDWTTLSLPEQQQLRLSLARFKMLRRLEFLGIAFHDLREFTRVISSFPILQHLSLHIGFSKYSDFIIASVSDFSLPQGITSVELGSEESNPVFLHLLLGPTAPLGLRRLALKNTQLQDLQLIRDVLATHSKNMEYIYIDCKANTIPNEEFMACYGVGTLKNIRSLHLDNIKLCSKSLPLFVEGLPTLQSHLASSCHYLQDVELGITPDNDIYSKMLSLTSLATKTRKVPTSSYRFRITITLDSSALPCWKLDQQKVEVMFKNLLGFHDELYFMYI